MMTTAEDSFNMFRPNFEPEDDEVEMQQETSQIETEESKDQIKPA